MTLRDAISALVVAAPPTATVPVEWLAGLLAADDGGSEAHSADTATPGVDLTVGQLAARFGKGSSTVRTWLARGELPGAYKLHGTEWRIPPAAIEAMQDRQREQHIAPRARTTARVADLGAWRKHSAGAR